MSLKNYSDNSVSSIKAGGGFDRDLDIEEEVLRRNAYGDMAKEFTKRSWEFWDFLNRVSNRNYYWLIYEISLSVILAIFFTIIFSCFFLKEIRQMKNFYRILFSISVRFFGLKIARTGGQGNREA